MKAEARAASARAARVTNSMAEDVVGLGLLKQRRTRYLRGREEDHHRRRGWLYAKQKSGTGHDNGDVRASNQSTDG